MSTLRKRLFVDEWVVIAPDRAARPRQLDLRQTADEDPFCPFCAEHADATPPAIQSWDSPVFDDQPWGVRSVPNKFPALRVEPPVKSEADGLYESHSGVGAHEVIIESPVHRRDWQSLSTEHIAVVLRAWQHRMRDLAGDQRLKCVIVFKNRGPRAGATLSHTHSQLVALPIVPAQLRREIEGARDYYDTHDRCGLCDVLAREQNTRQRLVVQNDVAAALTPFGSRMAFETWIMPRRHCGDFMDTSADELAGVAELISTILTLWRTALGEVDYHLILHTLPFASSGQSHYHWHLELLPRTGQVAGFEWGSGLYINATPSEKAAQHLRKLVDDSTDRPLGESTEPD